MITFRLPCVPPQKTAQGKRMRLAPMRTKTGVIKLVPRFYKKAAAKTEAAVWATLMQPWRPPVPIEGPVSLSVVFVYPHLEKTAKRDQARFFAKDSKPDASNAIKEFEDVLVAEGFIADDDQVCNLNITKFRGPADHIGIYVSIERFAEPGPGAIPCLNHFDLKRNGPTGNS